MSSPSSLKIIKITLNEKVRIEAVIQHDGNRTSCLEAEGEVSKRNN